MPYDPATHCCEDDEVVAKREIRRCKRYAEIRIFGWIIWDHYLCCDAGNGEQCYGMVPDTLAGRPVPPEEGKGGTCKKHPVCPTFHNEKCDDPVANQDQ